MYSTCFLEALVLKIKINRLASKGCLRSNVKGLGNTFVDWLKPNQIFEIGEIGRRWCKNPINVDEKKLKFCWNRTWKQFCFPTSDVYNISGAGRKHWSLAVSPGLGTSFLHAVLFEQCWHFNKLRSVPLSCSSEVFSNPFTVQYLFERDTSCSSALHLMASCILGFRDLSILIFQFLEESQLFSENFAASVFSCKWLKLSHALAARRNRNKEFSVSLAFWANKRHFIRSSFCLVKARHRESRETSFKITLKQFLRWNFVPNIFLNRNDKEKYVEMQERYKQDTFSASSQKEVSFLPFH